MSKKILIVDDEPNNLSVLRQVLSPAGYHLAFAKNGKEALIAAQKHQPDLVLLDIMMPEMDGYEVCTRLKENPSFLLTPVIFVTAMDDIENEAKGFDAGAVDYITKPVSPSVVLARVATHLSLVHTGELERVQKEAIAMLGKAGHYNDTDTGVHIWRMADYAAAMARAAGWSEENVELIRNAAPMHDTGKIGIPDEILKAPRKLLPQEWIVMKRHTEIGYEILTKGHTRLFKLAAEIALNHHEKWNGAGYPAGLQGEQIPESARITAIADVLDALTMERPYKQPWTLEEALEEIKKSSGQHFDPHLIKLLAQIEPQIRNIKACWDCHEIKSNLLPNSVRFNCF